MKFPLPWPATAGTVTTADFGRLKTLGMGKSPSHVPLRQAGTGDAVPAILLLRGPELMRQLGVYGFPN